MVHDTLVDLSILGMVIRHIRVEHNREFRKAEYKPCTNKCWCLVGMVVKSKSHIKPDQLAT